MAEWSVRRALVYGSELVATAGDEASARAFAQADIDKSGAGRITGVINETVYYTIYDEE